MNAEGATETPERVVVTGSRTRQQRVAWHWPVVRDIDEQTELGAVYVRSLMRVQLRLALATGSVVLAVVGGLPLIFAFFPAVTRMRLGAVPVPWLVLGLCVQPIWILLARWHLRRAERTERDFSDLVTRS